jgi:AraC-like DNA-binding protein
MKSILRVFTILLLLLGNQHAEAFEGHTFRAINASNELADNSAQIVACTKTGRMIIATLGSLNFYNGSGFSHISSHNDNQYQLPRYTGGYRMGFDRKHHIWLKNTHTLMCVDLLMERFITNVDSVINEMGFHEPIEDLFIDSIGDVWLLTENGLFGVNNQQTYTVLRDQNLQEVDVYDNQLLTFYGNGEEVGQDLKTGKTMHRTRAYDWDTGQRYNKASAILRYGNGYFMVRSGETESVLLHFDVKQLQWTVIQAFPFHVNHLALHNGKIYLPSKRGFGIFDVKRKSMDWVEEFPLVDGRVVRTSCNMIAFDRQDGMWVGTEERGVLYSRPAKLQFLSYPISSPEAEMYSKKMEEIVQNITEFQGLRANCMFMDSRGWSWIGTTTGLYLYKTPQSEPLVFSKKNGFYNDVVHTVVEDKNHNIWAATSNGVSFVRFKGENVEFVNSFDEIDGVPSESFVNCKGRMLDDGTIIMQAIDHVVRFNPDDLEEVNTPHPYKLFPKLIRLMVDGNNIEPDVMMDNNVIIDRALSRTWEIVLSSEHSSVSLTFSPLNYYRPLQTYYRIRIKGAKEYDEWKVLSFFNSGGKVDSKGMLHVPLLGLDPGSYQLELQASMYPNQWDGTPFTWNIIVNEPWWQTTGILWLLVVVVFMISIANLAFYMRNERMRMRRSHGEGDMIRKIRQFVTRCNTYTSETMSPMHEDYGHNSENADVKLSPEFMKVMMRILPYVKGHMKGDLSMAQLSHVAEMDVVPFYELMMDNIYKSPRDLARVYRLENATKLLLTTDSSIEQIADECGFYTTNYMIGTFFHQYKQTPQEYRESHK